MAGRLEGKVTIVTGGASGIGRATVELFVREGARVVIADIQDDKGQRLAEELGAHACYQHTDVTEEADVEAAVQRAAATFGRLDCMFNNAGFPGFWGGIETVRVDNFETTMRILVLGVVLGMKHAAPVMKRQGSGSIINTGSVAGLSTGLGDHIYSAAKAAVIHLTRSVAMELGEANVRVNCICPGGIATPIFGKQFGLPIPAADQTVEQVEQLFATLQPIARAGLPEDIARAALYLASDAASFVNGHALVVDGGLIAGERWSSWEATIDHLGRVLGAA